MTTDHVGSYGAIASAISRWTHLLDDGEYEQMSHLLAPTPLMIFPNGAVHRGREAIRIAVGAVQPSFPVKHVVGSVDVEFLDDGRAVAHTDVVTFGAEDAKSPSVRGMSRYNDVLIRTEAGWRFAIRVMTSAGAPYLGTDELLGKLES